VLRAAGSERPVVWAETEGTAMACLFAATHPELVSSLILFTPLPRVLKAPDYPWASDPAERATLIQGFIDGWGTGAAGKPLAPSLAEDARFTEWFGRLERLSHSPAEVWLHMARMAETDVRAVLPSVQAPTLVLHRKDDGMIDPRHARYVADKIPSARLRTLPGGDSLVFAGDVDELSDAIEEFVTGVSPASISERVLATVLFTDVVDSTRRASELGDRRWRALLDEHSTLVRDHLAAYGGNEVKTLGDGFLSTFDGPARAVRCALDIVNASESSGLEVRAGAHTGECEVSADDVTGIAVHIASRVTSHAGSGEVVVSRTVTDLVAGSELSFESLGAHELKGVPGSWELYAAAAS
jgi:class 3 adenylate cyclase